MRLQGALVLPTDYPDSESPCFVIHTIVLEGDGAQAFQWALDAAVDAHGRCLGTASINVVVGKIQNALVARGYVTSRAVAAPQDLQGGQLRLILVPGRVRSVAQRKERF